MIKIYSRKNLRAVLNKEPNTHTAIIISEPGNEQDVSDLFPLCKDYINLEFNDTTFPGRFGAPEKEHILDVLKWAEGRDEKILVACRAGVSRSSAIAYLVESQRNGPEAAANCLDKHIHHPNELIIKYGVELLGNEIFPAIRDFYIEACGYCILETYFE